MVVVDVVATDEATSGRGGCRMTEKLERVQETGRVL